MGKIYRNFANGSPIQRYMSEHGADGEPLEMKVGELRRERFLYYFARMVCFVPNSKIIDNTLFA